MIIPIKGRGFINQGSTLARLMDLNVCKPELDLNPQAPNLI